MEELNQEVQMQQKRICKYCNKGFPCGRSLGGHMRSHMNNNNNTSSTEPELKKKKMMMMVSNGGGGSNTVNNSSTLMEGYVLRENPKKTWRISDSSDGYLKEEKLFCKECGKGFHSSKALFGHMKCHSEKEKEVFESLMDDEEEEDDSWVDDDQSDNEAAVDVAVEVEASSPKGKRKMRRRSSRRTATRYNKTISTNAVATTTTTTTCSLSNFSNAASSVSEIEHEQEEVAMCLMMLSRDVNGFNCLAESSGNNSVLLEAKSLSTIAANKRFRTHVNVKEKKKKKKLGSLVSEPETVRFERKRSEMGSEFLRIGVKKVEPAHVTADGFCKDVEFKKSKMVQEAEFEVFDVEFERDSYNKKRVKCSTAELGKNLAKERSDLKFGNKYTSSNKRSSTRTDSYNDYELEGDSCKNARYDVSDSEICKESPKKSKYKCMTCNKTFHSYQALGGHRASHKKIKGCFASKVDSSENSIETDITLPDPKLMKSSSIEKEIEFEVTGTSAETSPSGLKKNKHECPICFKVFSSGQALGGHKRSHLLGATTSDQTRSNQSIVIQKQVQPEIRDLLDLNLPATGDEEDSNGDHQLEFKPWWVGNNHKHEQLVGLFSN